MKITGNRKWKYGVVKIVFAYTFFSRPMMHSSKGFHTDDLMVRDQREVTSGIIKCIGHPVQRMTAIYNRTRRSPIPAP